MQVTNFVVSPAICVPGETVNISFNIRADAGDAIYGLRIWLNLPGLGEVICHTDDNWTISPGSSRAVNLDVKMNPSPVVQELQERRSFAMETFGIQFGYFGSRVDVAFPFTFLDARYYPAIGYFNLERAADGVPDDEGENLLADMLLGASALAKAENMAVRLYYRQGSAADMDADYIDLTANLDALMAGVEDDGHMIAETFSKALDWHFLLWFGDEYESAQMGFLVARAFANMHLSGMETGGVCFGGFCTSTHGQPKLESHYPAHFYGGIQGVSNYVQGETATGGTWIDGKPIYRFVFAGTTTADGSAQTVATLPSAFDTIIGIRGVMRVSGANNIIPFTYAYFGSTSLTAGLLIGTTGEISVQLGSAYSGTQNIAIIVEYTKADVA